MTDIHTRGPERGALDVSDREFTSPGALTQSDNPQRPLKSFYPIHLPRTLNFSLHSTKVTHIFHLLSLPRFTDRSGFRLHSQHLICQPIHA